MLALSDLLRPLRVWADVLVVGAQRFREAAAVPGTLPHTVASEGKVLYGSRSRSAPPVGQGGRFGDIGGGIVLAP